MIENIRLIGHGSLQIIGNQIIYINPWRIPTNVSFLGDIILVGHHHYDHFSQIDIERLTSETTRIITNEKVATEMPKAEVIRPWQYISSDRVTIRAIPAYSPNDLRHPIEDGGLGFIVSVNFYDIYYTGDTKLIPEMSNIRPDILVIPIDDDGTMNLDEAVQAVELMRPKWVIPCNWGITGEGAHQRDVETFKRLVGNRAEVIIKSV
jgi:L-ascorbate metabolism protein UlaG (beta-lactamase superfamily)